MGADGGISWMELKDPRRYKRLMELLSPFPVTYWHNATGSGHDDEHWEYIKENSELQSEEYLLGVYGTDMGDIPDLHDLQNLVEIIRDKEVMSHHGIYPEVHTFLDLLEERETRPDSWWDYGPKSGPNFILSIMEFYNFDNGESIKKESVYKMTLKSWADEIESIVDIQNINSVETWT